MAESTSAGSQSKLKLIGGILFLIASVKLFVHRMPSLDYVEVHADKPRPAARTNGAAPAPSTAKIARAPEPARPVQPGESPTPTPLAELENVCSGEIGILCHKVEAKRLRPCLDRYEEVLRKNCRAALYQGRDAP